MQAMQNVSFDRIKLMFYLQGLSQQCRPGSCAEFTLQAAAEHLGVENRYGSRPAKAAKFEKLLPIRSSRRVFGAKDRVDLGAGDAMRRR